MNASASVSQLVVQLLKSWEYKNSEETKEAFRGVVQLLKSWEYKNPELAQNNYELVVQLLKSWEYKNLKFVNFDFCALKNIIKP